MSASGYLWPTTLALNIATAILGNQSEALSCVMYAIEEMRDARLAKIPAHVRAPSNYRSDPRIAALRNPSPRGDTLCGAPPSGRDHTEIGARTVIRDAQEPFLSQLCPACRAKLEAAGAKSLAHLSERRSSASDRQVQYLRILLREAFVAQYKHGTGLDDNHLGGVSAREASAAIDTLKAAKQRGWK